MKIVSIHAPAWGATFTQIIPGHTYDVSIHAPAWGATLTLLKKKMMVAGFNPRPRMGGDGYLIKW